jgi:hypothetical protein
MPAKTLELLDELQEKWGMMDSHFQQLHHFGARASIAAHRKFCRSESEFKPGSNHAKVRRRLEIALAQRREGALWPQAIRVALKE